MSKQKKIFLLLALVFLAITFYFAWDLARQTSAPWGKKSLERRIMDEVK